ncbi:hypothetical protein BDW42DRAFT_194486 [Aspergillus taichungensis]|uniref:Uncharacterized protein n=1 Tax=Aspergillus taichungensis TaxID=482145 RepID=A0A2J5HST3_9EURO|nr:hypothetical protein BDW42DRAFT_194486 [Aspergillus taichungensis]
MTESPPAKHARANSAGDVHIPAHETQKDTHLNVDQIKESGGAVVEQIRRVMDDVVRHCGEHASPQTRWNGLSVLRKIGKTLALSRSSTLAADVTWDPCLEDGMLEILASMSREEKVAIRRDERSKALWPKLVELDGLRQEQCILENMEKVLSELDHVGTDQEVSEGESDDHGSQSTD